MGNRIVITESQYSRLFLNEQNDDYEKDWEENIDLDIITELDDDKDDDNFLYVMKNGKKYKLI